jgi:acetate kinase
VDLPPEVSTYAVPYELRKKGVRRYGGQGLLHQWAWDKVKASAEKNISKALSVYLGDYSNMVAVKDGLPRETSMGFTSVEGIISAVSCGDIDPTVIFQLYSTGMSFEAINSLLSKESGFTALLGRKAGFSDLLDAKRGAKEIALNKIYCYNILKYLGGFICALGGVDTLVFTGEEIKRGIPLVRRICENLGFLGLKLRPRHTAGKGVISLTQRSSRIKVFCLEYDRWEILAQRFKEGLK